MKSYEQSASVLGVLQRVLILESRLVVLSVSEKLHNLGHSFPGLPTQLEVTGWWLPFPKTLPFQKILVLSFLETFELLPEDASLRG